ncbi:MAG TPA: NAD(P)H-dependent oxidoreductase [Polyangiaceae bacterium]|nr:NAD(P)H-dependent oxidoreductase [Polyangiaceae bacterium]
MRVLAICGSLQEKSSNLTLLRTAIACAPAGLEIDLYDGLRDLPHFNPDLASDDAQAGPSTVAELRRAVAGSDALLIATPEYGHSLPGALKNAIDWLIGTGELEGKLVAITSAVAAKERGRLGLAALRSTLGAVSARIAFQEPIARGLNFEPEIAEMLQQLVTASQER